MARLVLSTAEGQQVVDLRPNNSLGRHPSNSIQLLDKIVSKEHCLIELRGATFVLRDLGSLNGTFVNRDRVIGEMELKHGDEIALGQTKARFENAPATGYPQAPQAGWQGEPSQQAPPPQQWPGQGQPQQGPAYGAAHSGTPAAGVPVVHSQQQPAYVRQQPPTSAAPQAYARQQSPPATGQARPPGPPPPSSARKRAPPPLSQLPVAKAKVSCRDQRRGV